jgi:hypothetical protein
VTAGILGVSERARVDGVGAACPTEFPQPPIAATLLAIRRVVICRQEEGKNGSWEGDRKIKDRSSRWPNRPCSLGKV